MNRIAVLITCHNRKEKTVLCLRALFGSTIPHNFTIEVFLVDDGSTDGTSEAVKKHFPEVIIIKGNGTLFWNQGMRLAWDTAQKTKNYDFFMWLNDDTYLDKVCLANLIQSYHEAVKIENEDVIITTACRQQVGEDQYSYGGSDDSGHVVPNGKLQKCKFICGNVVLVPRNIFNCIGNLSNEYTHAMGDTDYGLRAIQNGFSCYTTKEFLATCAPNPPNNEAPGWCNPKNSLKKRWQLFHSPLGLNIEEYKVFIRKFWPKQYYFSISKAYIKCLAPSLYYYLKKNKNTFQVINLSY
jgi:GT2 family glycosyltransferase